MGLPVKRDKREILEFTLVGKVPTYILTYLLYCRPQFLKILNYRPTYLPRVARSDRVGR
jgi:hypothetical protein